MWQASGRWWKEETRRRRGWRRLCASGFPGRGDDLSDEGLTLGWGGGDLEGFAEHGFGFGEEGLVFGEEGDEGLAGFEAVA